MYARKILPHPGWGNIDVHWYDTLRLWIMKHQIMAVKNDAAHDIAGHAK